MQMTTLAMAAVSGLTNAAPQYGRIVVFFLSVSSLSCRFPVVSVLAAAGASHHPAAFKEGHDFVNNFFTHRWEWLTGDTHALIVAVYFLLCILPATHPDLVPLILVHAMMFINWAVQAKGGITYGLLSVGIHANVIEYD